MLACWWYYQAKSVNFDAQSGMAIFHMDFDFYKAIGKALQQELQTAFEQVYVVEGKVEGVGIRLPSRRPLLT